MRARDLLLATAVLAAGGAASTSSGCGARTQLPVGSDASVCAEGSVEPCEGPGSCQGSRRCEDADWSACQCAPVDAAVCFDQIYDARTTGLSLAFAVDRSTSMLVFWPEVRLALGDFFADPASAGLRVALDFFPATSGGAVCEEASYLVPDVPFGQLAASAAPADAQEQALLDLLARVEPNGSTPMLPAYSGAIEASKARAREAGPGETVVVVLVTDGEPAGCEGTNTTPRVVELAGAAASGSPKIRSFAIGLEGASDVLVEKVAERGNGEAFFIEGDSITESLTAAFEKIRNRLACDYDVLGVEELAPADVTVTFDAGDGTERTLPFDPGCARGGWELASSAGGGFRVSLCERACLDAKGVDRGRIRVSARCAQVGPIGTGGAGGGTAGTGGGGPTNAALGKRCADASDCGTPLTCLAATSTALDGGGPPGGLCTLPCSDHLDCEAIDEDSRCEALGTGGTFCVERCTVGPFGLMQFDPRKCHGREEFACSPLGSSAARPTCLPQCNADGDCPEGRHCDPKDGLCRDVPRKGLPTGAACSSSDECLGECLGSDASFLSRTCTEWCTSGAAFGCGWAGPGTGLPEAFCFLPLLPVLTRGGPGLGDLSACVELCDTDADCSHAQLGCEAFAVSSYSQITGRKGMCGISMGFGLPPPN